MKYVLLFIVFALCFSALPGCGDDGDRDEMEASVDVESYEQALDSSQKWTEEFVEVLRSIKDNPSMQAALPRFEELGQQRNDYLIRFDAMRPPSPEMNAMLVSNYGEQFKSLQEQITVEMIRLGMLGDEVAEPVIKAIQDIIESSEVKELPAWLEPHKS